MDMVKLEAISWLTKAFGEEERKRKWEEGLDGATTVREFFLQLCDRYPKFAELVYDVSINDLRGVVSIVINDRLLELAGGLDAEIHDGDTLVLVPAFAGGA